MRHVRWFLQIEKSGSRALSLLDEEDVASYGLHFLFPIGIKKDGLYGCMEST